MHNLVPHFILENFAQGNLQGEFPTAGLFLDISGFTNLTESLLQHGQHGAEVLAAVMRSIFDPLVRHVYAHGGFVSGFAGDAFTAVFPKAEGRRQKAEADDTYSFLCALAAAWRMQQHMLANSRYDTLYGSFPISAKIGIGAGQVNWGILASADRVRAIYYFRGSAIDCCVTAEKLASQGQVVIHENLYGQVREMVTAEPAGGCYRLTHVSAPLPAPQAIRLPPADAGLMARFFPREVIDQPYSGEFRQAVNVFVNLPTVRTEAQLAIFMQSVFALQRQYGGLLNRIDFGDKGSNLLLFWGAPRAYENDIERALCFVLALQLRTSIPISAGITYHIAHAGFSGSSLFEEYTCYGRGVNLASRFMTAAPRGEIWVDEQIAQRAQGQFDIEFEAEMAFKGFAGRQPVYVLFERKEQAARFYREGMLGRQREMAQLTEFVRPLADGQFAGVLVIWGEAGIGKSRLVHEFLKTSEVSETSEVFLCQTDEILRQSLNPFRYWLRGYFGQSAAQSEARNKRNFNRKLDTLIAATDDPALAQELDRTRSFLAALVDLQWPDSLYSQLEPKGRFENTLIALIVLLQAESLRKPVLILLEDAHWLDEDSAQLLQRLALSVAAAADMGYPIAIIATARPEQAGRIFAGGPAYQELVLGPLSRDDLGHLAADILNGAVAPALLDWLVERAEGNPFFAAQVIYYLQQRNLLVRDESGWTVETQPLDLLPTDVRAILVARLDRLANDVKEVVQTAAALGREFEVRLLALMLRDETGLPRILDQAEQAAIWSALSQLRYLFTHALLRDAAYKMQLRARRQALHRLAAEALTTLYADDLSPHYGELAYHTELAGLVEQARHYLQQAGDVAQAAYQNSQAVDYYSRALALTPTADLDSRYALLLAREAIYDLQGAREVQAQDLATLATLAEQLNDPGKQAQVALRRSQLAMNTADYPAAIAAAEQAIAQAQAAGEATQAAAGHRLWALTLRLQGAYPAALVQYEIARGLAQAAGADQVWAHSLQGLGGVAFYQGAHARAREYFEEALGIYRQLGDRQGESNCLHSLGVVAKNLGDYVAAQAYAEQALSVYRQIGHRQGEGLCLTNLASIARRESDFTRAQSYYGRALSISRQVGDRSAEGQCLNNLGIVACDLGNYPGAERYLQQALSIYRDIGDRWGESLCLNNLGITAHDMRDLLQAQTYLEQGLAICREIGFREGEGTILSELGAVAFDLGNYDEARAIFDQALALRRELDHPHYVAEDLVGLAQVSLALGNPAQARTYIMEVLTYLEDNPTMAGAERPFRVHLICYQVLRVTGDERALVVLAQAYELLQARAAKITDEALRQSFLQNVPVHGEIVGEFVHVNNQSEK